MRYVTRLLGLAALVAGSISCGDVVRDGRSTVYLALDSLTAAGANVLQSRVIVVAPGACSVANPCNVPDVGVATFRIVPKDVTTTIAGPTTNVEVTITRYHVSYRRTDGRNAVGVDVPYAFDGAVRGTVPVGNSTPLGFELVRRVAKDESPLVQLATSRSVITMIADVTFYGTDRVGHAVSATGSIQIDFGNF
jgi:hypothetical protein